MNYHFETAMILSTWVIIIALHFVGFEITSIVFPKRKCLIRASVLENIMSTCEKHFDALSEGLYPSIFCRKKGRTRLIKKEVNEKVINLTLICSKKAHFF